MVNSFGQNSIKEDLKDSLNYDKYNILNIDASLDVELLPQIKKFTKVRRLFIRNMNEFIPEITKLKNLYQLKIINSTFETLPSNFGDLENLKELEIDANLKELPASFEKLQKLTDLYLNGNSFTSFPKEITKLMSLKSLILDENKIIEIHSDIQYMIGLEGLSLTSNKIEKLPKEMGKLKSLILLDVSSNPLKDLPMELAKLPHLMNIVIKDTFISKETQIQFQEYAKPRKIGIMANKDK